MTCLNFDLRVLHDTLSEWLGWGRFNLKFAFTVHRKDSWERNKVKSTRSAGGPPRIRVYTDIIYLDENWRPEDSGNQPTRRIFDHTTLIYLLCSNAVNDCFYFCLLLFLLIEILLFSAKFRGHVLHHHLLLICVAGPWINSLLIRDLLTQL